MLLLARQAGFNGPCSALQDFLDAVTKVIKGLSKFSATPAYMVSATACQSYAQHTA